MNSQRTIEGMRIDRELFRKFEDRIIMVDIIKKNVELGNCEQVASHIQQEIFDKPHEYFANPSNAYHFTIQGSCQQVSGSDSCLHQRLHQPGKICGLMSEKFKGKYRNESARLQNWDYGSNAAYFITICTKDREHYFGANDNNKLQISPAGAIAFVLWYEIKNHAQNIELGEFVVMPNHVHGILILNGNNVGTTSNVVTTHALSLPPPPPGQQRFQNQGKNTISSIVGSYKSAVTN